MGLDGWTIGEPPKPIGEWAQTIVDFEATGEPSMWREFPDQKSARKAYEGMRNSIRNGALKSKRVYSELFVGMRGNMVFVERLGK